MPDKQIMEMSAVELRNLKTTLTDENSTPEQRALLDDRIIDVVAEEKATAIFARAESRRKAQTLDEQAYKRWPALRDKESEFRKAVNAELEARGDSETNERAMMDAANSVAMEKGLVHEGWKPAESTIQAHSIKAPGDPDAHGENSSTSYTENNSIFDALVKDGFLKSDDEASIARINKAGEALNNG